MGSHLEAIDMLGYCGHNILESHKGKMGLTEEQEWVEWRKRKH